MSPRIYLYKITFKGRPEWYVGIHKEKRYGEFYMGSPCSNKHFWDLYEPRKQIIEEFDFSEEGWQQALVAERSIIKPNLNNPLCLNENCGGIPSPRRMKEFWESSPELKQKLSILMAELSSIAWNDPEFRKRRSKTSGETLRKLWDSKKFRNEVAERNRVRAQSLRQQFEENELNSLFKLLKNSEIDLSKIGWVSKVAKLWSVSHSQVRRLMDRYWEGPAPYKRSKASNEHTTSPPT